MPNAETITQAPEPKKKKHGGGWPKHVRRNADNGKWSRTVKTLKRLVDQHGFRGWISYTVCASAIGVNEKTVRRWRDNIDRPPIDTQELLIQWIAEKRAELGTKKRPTKERS